MSTPEHHYALYALSFPSSSCLVFPPTFARSLFRTAGLTLHLLHRETARICTRNRIVALRVPLLATEAELLVLLLALASAGASFPAVRLGVVGLEANVEEVLFVGLGNVCTLAF